MGTVSPEPAYFRIEPRVLTENGIDRFRGTVPLAFSGADLAEARRNMPCARSSKKWASVRRTLAKASSSHGFVLARELHLEASPRPEKSRSRRRARNIT